MRVKRSDLPAELRYAGRLPQAARTDLFIQQPVSGGAEGNVSDTWFFGCQTHFCNTSKHRLLLSSASSINFKVLGCKPAPAGEELA
jgi:hypothetical protein